VLEELLKRGYKFPQVTTWTRATPKDIKMMVDVTQGSVKETGMLASSSDHHIFDKLGFKSKEEAMDKYLAPIITAVESKVVPRVHLEDATKADIYGFVIPFIQRVQEETHGLAKFRVCDTLGVGVPDPYAALPFGIPRLISTLVKETGAEIEFHGHNDFGYATANTVMAWQYGAKRANVAFGGLGERTGNTCLEQVLANYIRLYGDPGFKLEALPQMRDLIDKEVSPISSKQPIIGEVFSSQAGIHQTGLSRQDKAQGGAIYLPFAPELLGETDYELNKIGALSGMDGIVSVLNRYVKAISGQDGKYTTTSRTAKYIYDKVQEAYDGVWNENTRRWTSRRTFFTPEEIYSLAMEFEQQRSAPTAETK
jgi:isopropylmalate/homocitrate/citramalate synthase